MRVLGWVLTILGFLVQFGGLYGAWRNRVPWVWLDQGLWTLVIVAGGAITLLGYRFLASARSRSN